MINSASVRVGIVRYSHGHGWTSHWEAKHHESQAPTPVAEGLKVERGSDSDPERRNILSRGSEGDEGGGGGTEGKMEKQTIKPRQEEEKPKERRSKVRKKKTENWRSAKGAAEKCCALIHITPLEFYTEERFAPPPRVEL